MKAPRGMLVLYLCASFSSASCQDSAPDAPAPTEMAGADGEPARDGNQPAEDQPAAGSRTFAGITGAPNACAAAADRAEQLVRASRELSPARQAMSHREIFELQRHAFDEAEAEAYASCLWAGNDQDLVWASGMVMAMSSLGVVRTALEQFRARYPGELAQSPAGRFLEQMDEMLADAARMNQESRLVAVDGGYRIVDGEGEPNHFVVQRNGSWYVVNPTDRADVVVELYQGSMAMIVLSELILDDIHGAEDLDDLTARFQVSSARVSADFQVWLAAAVAQYAPSTTSGANACPQCGAAGFIAGRCYLCNLDLTGARW